MADAALIQRELREQLSADRVFAAAPRVRYDTTGQGKVPDPRSSSE